MEERRKHLTEWLLKELGDPKNVKEFSSHLRELGIADLKQDKDLAAVTEHGLIDTLVVLYRFGTMSKIIEVKNKIQKEL